MPSVGLSAYGLTGAELVELAVCADVAGFDALWLGEHVLRPVVQAGEHPSAGTKQHHSGPLVAESTELVDPLLVHAAIAARTTRIRLGTAVYVAPLRHPLHIARTTITLHELSAGRVLLGIGAGWLKEEFEALEVPFRTRVSRTQECLEILRKAWSGAEFAHVGAHFRFPAVQLHSRPVDIPVVLGGNSEAALARAARLGDGWFTSGTPTFAQSNDMVSRIRHMCADFGRPAPIACYVRIAAPDAADMDRYREHGMEDLVLWADTVWHGRTLEERRDNLAAAAEQLGLSASRPSVAH